MNPRVVISMALPLSLAACGSDPKPPPAAPAGEVSPGSARTEPQEQAKDPTKGSVRISDEIRKACGISEHDAYFGYNSARLDARAKTLLEKLAKCFKDGPLVGRQMVLVGHADPRGDAEYNLLLGGKRADGVKTLLIGYGLTADRVTTTSRGEMEASGTDEASWAKDRRVDVDVGS